MESEKFLELLNSVEQHREPGKIMCHRETAIELLKMGIDTSRILIYGYQDGKRFFEKIERENEPPERS